MKLPVAATLLICLTLMCRAASPGAPIPPARLDSIMGAIPLTPIEGVWKFLPDNASVAIIRQPGESGASGPLNFNIYIYSTVTSRILPGTPAGTLSVTPVENEYRATMWINPLSPSSRKQRSFICRLNDPAHLSFTKEKTGLSVDLWRMLPYLFRVSVTQNPNRAADGCVKISPLTPGVSEPVRYL